MQGDTEICRILLANGAELDVVDGTDMSAFQYAKAEQHEGVLTLLSTRKVNKAVEMLKFHKMQREQKNV